MRNTEAFEGNDTRQNGVDRLIVAVHGQTMDPTIDRDQTDQSSVAPPRPVRSKSNDLYRLLGAELLSSALHGLSQRDIAAAIDVSHQHVAQMLNGDRPWKLEHFVRVVRSYRMVGAEIVWSFARYLVALWGAEYIDVVVDGLRVVQAEAA